TIAIILGLYKDEIHAKVKAGINEQINAKLDYRDFDLSILRNFPYLTFSLEGLRISGVGPFEKDTLAQIERFDLAVNLMNVLRKEKIEIRKIALKSPKIYAHVLADGRANWDIAKPDTAPEVEDTVKKEPPSDFALKLSKIEIRDGDAIYHDQAQKMHAEVRNLDFWGKGDFSAEQYDLSTETRIEKIDFSMDGVKYVDKLKFESDLTASIDSKNAKYTLKDNRIKLNELELQFDGFVQTPDSTVAMDLKFKALETRFLGILSLIPGIYTQDFASLKTDGTLALDGFVKGVYAENVYPSFDVKLKVANAFVQYPDLPAPVKNIQLDVNAANSSSNLDNTVVDVKRFHLEIEDNPVDLQALIKGLENPEVDATAKAKVDLGKLARVVPMQGLTLKGLLDLNAIVKGKIAENSLPALDAKVQLSQGYVKSAEFPAAVENLRLTAAAQNPTGANADMDIDVSDFHAEIDKEPLDAKLKLHNLDDPDYRLTLKGRLDFEKLLKIYPVEGLKMKGILTADLQTEGRMSAVEKQRFEALPTSGTLKLQSFEYKGDDPGQDVRIENADLLFTPHHIQLKDFRSTLAGGDMALDGRVENYIGYLFSDKTLKGTLNARSKRLNLNAWMSDEPAPAEPQPESEPPLEAPEIPKNIDFTLNADMAKVFYDNLTLENVRGKVVVRDQTVDLSDLRFRLLGAAFSTSGKYIGKDPKSPLYEFGFKIDS
ncbi:MAG: AsmA family protein, partial [Bacteroidia bacterium]|nr:AsmA family protein [Bacteroidia bacterium]